MESMLLIVPPLYLLLSLASLLTPALLLPPSTSLPSFQSCAQAEFFCRTDRRCISMLKHQDGIPDCSDGSDEECLPWQFDCGFGRPKCVSQKAVNDGLIDCMSGLDEGCPAEFFVCQDRSNCLDPGKYLDGISDCADASDEPCAHEQFLCSDRSSCIPAAQFQDGRVDCPDGSDEECTALQFECACGQPRCIDQAKVKDGILHCSDGSDEINSTTKNNTSITITPSPCPDRQKSRAVAKTKLACQRSCPVQLGMICTQAAGDNWRCVCKIGTVQAPGMPRCVPVALLADFLLSTNCTDLQHLHKHLHPISVARQNSTQQPTITLNFLYEPVQSTQTLPRLRDQCSPSIKDSCPGHNQSCVRHRDGYHVCLCDNVHNDRGQNDSSCIEAVNECESSTMNECDENAICIDNPTSYECLCREGFIDVSTSPNTRPGLRCLPLVDECEKPHLHDCSTNADCVDEPRGFTCRCRKGFRDSSPEGARKPGRSCVPLVDECASGMADCDSNAKCLDREDGYRCRCRDGFVDTSPDQLHRPGRRCALASTDCPEPCDLFAECVIVGNDTRQCRCLPGYEDNSQTPGGSSGISCIRTTGKDPCEDYSLHDCDSVAECFSDQPGFFQCRCPAEYVDISPDKAHFPGRKCKKVVNECQLGTHECDANAECLDRADGYACRCKAAWSDVSPDPLNAPGRVCRKGDACARTQCAPEAECRESAGGPVCQCSSGFVDVSRQHGQAPGRTCRRVTNECAEHKDDCSSQAACIDTADSFTCRCKDGFRDESPDPIARPGRLCVRAFVPPPPECDVNDPLSCDQKKAEVCRFLNGTYKCDCAHGYSRLPDGRCLVINECRDPRLNDCATNADCIDQAAGYICQCKSGFVDVSGGSGHICRERINECLKPKEHHVDCDAHAICTDTDDSFTCRCQPGFADISSTFNQLPGRRCVEAINECRANDLNDCSENAICEDAKEGYTCTCRPGFVDASANITHYPGRICNKPRPISLPTNALGEAAQLDACDPKSARCGSHETCTDRTRKGQFVCECVNNAFRFSDGSCRLFSACNAPSNCDKNALCANKFDDFECQCRPGWIDRSPDPERQPGRVCKELVNECATNEHTCSPYASCVDSSDSYACVCREGFMDTSSQFALPPGRRCSNASNECASRALHTCDENADCVDTADAYFCQCFDGFVDVSNSAGLPPGRVCTVQTTCPKQNTDLMFLIDGSGSIGSFVFRNEVLRFVAEFVQLFEIGLNKTRVGLIQYSDQIRHEFDLNQYADMTSVLHAISQVQYLTGLTRTGAAIQHMLLEGFSERRGARPPSRDVSRVAIVLTDGRSQDNVSDPAHAARRLNINTFSIGVTDHVLASELEAIAGSPNRWFYVDRFKDLDTRLRSLIQKAACPMPEPSPKQPGIQTCNVDNQSGCDRALNEICIQRTDNQPHCACPEGFQRNHLTRVCGGELCNPQLLTSCANPEICLLTPLGNFRCVCPENMIRESRTGLCVTNSRPPLPTVLPSIDDDCSNGNKKCPKDEHCVKDGFGQSQCRCLLGLERNPRTGECTVSGSCSVSDTNACDSRKREKCLPHTTGAYHTCQCVTGDRRHPVTGVCLRNECATGEHDCASTARCIDTDDYGPASDGFICACPSTGYIDSSADPVRRPGRKCTPEQNECLTGTHKCSSNAICTDTATGYVCQCKPGYVDYSPNPQSFGGVICQQIINECSNPRLNTCHVNADCIDTVDSYKCLCKVGYVDLDELRNPGRNCQKVQNNDRCSAGRNDCDRQARCIPNGESDYECVCLAGFRDKSQDPNKSGRVCIPLIPECDNAALNDCDSPDRAICTDTDEGYLCRCKSGFLDISPNIANKPGRLCKPLENECDKALHDCARDGAICEDTPDSFTCRCRQGYLDVSLDRKNRPGRQCKRLVDECSTGQNDCAREATCSDTEDSFVCACPGNFIDVSPDTKRPGRRCLLRVNECTENKHDCSPNADCLDTPEAYHCKCREDFVDESPEPSTRPGRICRPQLIDECRLSKHDCHNQALCIDLPQGYSCQCKPEYLDQSPNRVTHPGRLCIIRPTPPPDECRVDLLTSCNHQLNEVCRLITGVPKCSCPINYSRQPGTGVCSVINECLFPQMNDCHPSAECIDQPDGFTCKCRQNFKDVSPQQKPGRNCKQLINECQFPHLNDCNQNSQCIDLEDGYECRCHSGFMDRSPQNPGRICQLMVNECAKSSLNSCDKNAECFDEQDGYKCQCKKNFLDISPSPTLPGRACRQIVNECLNPKLNDCDRQALCEDRPDGYTCKCPSNSRDISPNAAFPGRVCLIFENECITGKHDCDPNAICRDNEQSFTCECAAGYTDRSPNKAIRPGRVCVQLVDECATKRHTCGAQAECRDLEEGYTCECRPGYVDRSPNLLAQPGRVCATPDVCPSNHECSSAAVCEPLGDNKYTCTCIQGYVDQTPTGASGRVCVRNNACRDARLNNCSRNAICYDEATGGYRCECARGYSDRSPDPKFSGRVCEPPAAPTPPPPPTPSPRHPCQDPQLHDCHPAGTCRSTGAQSYTCECLQGYVDRSPDIKKPGRVCVLSLPICLDPTQNNCHPAAICSDTTVSGGDKYQCRCRDGYIDRSPDKLRKPGRNCIEMVNECLDRSLNDCDPLAVCEDTVEGYTCRCPMQTQDRSPDPKRLGRKCFEQVNECRNPALNNCSRFAECIDKPDGYSCACRNGYNDDNPQQPGTACTYIINECESSNLNDCSPFADCVDKLGGYTCRCKSPHRDISPERPGRICRLDECEKKMHDCHPNALCQDLDDGYVCHCMKGFYDSSLDPQLPGRNCIAFQVEQPSSRKPQLAVNKDGIPCGHLSVCSVARNESCIEGIRCDCRHGHSRRSSRDRCEVVERTQLAFRVTRRGNQPLLYSSEYGNPENPAYVEITDQFGRDFERTFGGTSYASRYVNCDISYITHPKTVNSSWPDGLLFNFSVATIPSSSPVDVCNLWDELMASLRRSNGAIGGGELKVASDVDLLDPCRQPEDNGDTCGRHGQICKSQLGEVCIADSVCACPGEQKRASSEEPCRTVETWHVPLWVIRKQKQNLVFNETFSDPLNPVTKAFMESLERGIAQCYPHTTLRNAFVAAEVSEVVDPMMVNASWDTGLLFNVSVHFRKGMVRVPSDCYHTLLKYIIDKNNYQVGQSGLYLNPYQSDPFRACFRNDCHPKGRCIDLGPNAYRCECGSGYRDLSPIDPGRKCLPSFGYNECERAEDNECSEHARCIDQEHLYKCECLPSFVDGAPSGAVPGSVCVLDYCSDVSYCPRNTTCVNEEEQAQCKCDRGFLDVRKSEKRREFGLDESLCLASRDVDECALGLTNCSGVAECTDKAVGYECRCPADYIDGNPDEPGRVCGALLCSHCNGHGDCVHNALTNNVTCVCSDGWSGELCQVAPSNASLILLVILALLFLLLSLCCLFYFCLKCRCFRGRGLLYREPLFTYRKGAWPWSTLEASSSSESGADFSALSASHDLYPEIGIPRAKLKQHHSSSTDHQHHLHHLENSTHLHGYLDNNDQLTTHIPRARLDVPIRHQRTSSDGFDSSSQSSSEYTIREEVERRITTDVTKTETRKTVTADVHDSATAHFHVYPPIEPPSVGAETSRQAEMMRNNVAGLMDQEQERGESVAEFSIGNAGWQSSHMRNSSNGGEKHRQLSSTEFLNNTDRDAESVASDEGVSYDKKVLVTRNLHPTGEHLRSEVTTTTTSHSTKSMQH